MLIGENATTAKEKAGKDRGNELPPEAAISHALDPTLPPKRAPVAQTSLNESLRLVLSEIEPVFPHLQGAVTNNNSALAKVFPLSPERT